jgi:hypothetical protein
MNAKSDEIKHRITKTEKLSFLKFVQSEPIQLALKSIPKHLHHMYLREAFASQSGVNIKLKTYYKLMRCLKNNQFVLGSGTIILI